MWKELIFNFWKLKELNVILFEMNTIELLSLLFAEGKDKNIIIDGFVYTVINIHINFSLVYEKVTYQVININLIKSTNIRNYQFSHTNINVTAIHVTSLITYYSMESRLKFWPPNWKYIKWININDVGAVDAWSVECHLNRQID